MLLIQHLLRQVALTASCPGSMMSTANVPHMKPRADLELLGLSYANLTFVLVQQGQQKPWFGWRDG